MSARGVITPILVPLIDCHRCETNVHDLNDGTIVEDWTQCPSNTKVLWQFSSGSLAVVRGSIRALSGFHHFIASGHATSIN